MNIGNQFKNSWGLVFFAASLLAAAAIIKFDFNFVDYIVDRVEQRLDLNYSPYGPDFDKKDSE